MTEDARTIVHLSPARRDLADFILRASLERLSDASQSEQLWARQLAPDAFEICCIPFFTYGLALGDIVEVDESLCVTRRTRASGRAVIRIAFSRDRAGVQAREAVIGRLNAIQALCEWHGDYYVAIDSAIGPEAEQWADLMDTMAGVGVEGMERGDEEPE